MMLMNAKSHFARLLTRSSKSGTRKRRRYGRSRQYLGEVLEDRCLLAGILSVVPSSAMPGTQDLLVTLTLESNATPPPPPSQVAPTSATIGTIEGSALTRNTQGITATFDIPVDESVGVKDVAVSFPGPFGTITYTMDGGFSIVGSGLPVVTITATDASAAEAGLGTGTFTISRLGVAEGDLTVPLSLSGSATEGDDFQAITRAAVIPAGQSSVALTLTPVDDAVDESRETVVLTISADAAYTVGTAGSATVNIADNDGVVSNDTYVVVDTNQTKFFNNTSEITAPSAGDAFYGQDASFTGNAPSYTLSADGRTVDDNVTGLTWTQSADWDDDGDIDAADKFSFTEFLSYVDILNAQNYGGYSDWRAPTIKELYSLMDFSGRDVSGYNGTDTSGLEPFIDTDHFDFGYGDTSAWERIIDAQFWSSTEYVGTTMGGNATTFGLNLADGRIKGYPQVNKDEYAYFVRGNTDYGVNNFVDNLDRTITDAATGLMWSQDDSAAGMDWEAALAWVQQKNDDNYLGHNDWRLPNAKELQSIVDYSRSPQQTGSAAIDPVFNITSITVEDGGTDWPSFWSGTTHETDSAFNSGKWGAYVCFGEALGYWGGSWQDVHGAGAQRSDPKYNDGTNYSTGHGPQGDAVRIDNFVRLVRDAGDESPTLSLSIAAVSVSESAGAAATTGTVTRSGGDSTSALTVTLASNDTSEATVPATVVIPANQASATFDTAAVDDAVVDGTQTVTVSASATGYTGGSDTLDVTDDDQNQNQPPTAVAGGPYSATQGTTITLSGSGSTDTDGSITAYEWDLDNDGQYDDATGVTTGFTASSTGISTVGLQVTDDDGATDSDTATVNVAEQGTPFEGYNLFSSLQSTTAYLMDNNGNFVHSWDTAYRPGNSMYFLEDGELLRTGNVGNTTFNAGGEAGIVQTIDWDGNVTWEYEYSSTTHLQHHDVEMLPNGNVLMVAWQMKTGTEAIAAGRDTSLLTDGELWPDSVIEVQPTGPTTGTIVWEWHAWDHLVQDYDSSKTNYGVVADHPELIDLNYAMNGGADWNHTNSVDYNAELDQIVLSVHNFSEIWVIDHTTTAAEAAGHSGGDSGMGGDLLYRWGNPQTYDAGTSADQQLFLQHDAEWIEAGDPGEGNILIFNNGGGRPGGNYSSIEEITPPVNPDGSYTLVAGSAYGPDQMTWNYTAETPTDFYSQNISGQQRLANGNTLICDGPSSFLFEVTTAGETVWEYDYTGAVFRVERYAPEYPGFDGTPLDDDAGIYGYVWNDADVDQLWDEGEDALEGWTVYVDSNANGQPDAGEPSDVTDATGYYEIGGLTLGTHTLAQVVEDGWTQTWPAASDLSHTVILSQESSWVLAYFGNDLATSNVPPTAEAGGPYRGVVGGTITLGALASTDTDGLIVLYEWDLNNDGQYDDATGATADFSSSTAGTFTVGLQVTDNDGASDTDTATVTVTADPVLTVAITGATISEDGGTTTGTVARSDGTTGDLIVTLASNDTTEATVPATVTIADGASSAQFTVAAVDDTLVDGTQTVTISASAGAYIGGSDTLDVTDNEALALSLSIASASVSETAGAAATTATVTRNDEELSSPLTVTLASSDTSEATVAATVVIPANQTSATFPIAAVDDTVADGTRTVIISAAAGGYTIGDDTLDVTDDEVDTTVDLPVAGGAFEVLLDGPDIVVRHFNGAAIWRNPAASTNDLTINGSDHDDQLIVDWRNGIPLPVNGLAFHGSNQDAGGDSLALVNGTVVAVGHNFANGNDGSVNVDGRMLNYTGLEPILDSLIAGDRLFAYGAAPDSVTLSDDGLPGNGVSRLAAPGTAETVDFVNPSNSLTVNTGDGDDTITASAVDSLFNASLALNGSGGEDHVNGSSLFFGATLTGGSGSDILIGGRGDDSLEGGDGNDSINGNLGDDLLFGGNGYDSVRGGGGRDTLAGDAGDDSLRGQGGADRLDGGDGNDRVEGGTSNDRLLGGDGNDSMFGDVGRDTMYGGGGHDVINGGDDGDRLYGDAGDDTMYGGQGNDRITGGQGEDWLLGGSNNDTLSGGARNDVLQGGTGKDRVNGQGSSRDTLSGGSGDGNADRGDQFGSHLLSEIDEFFKVPQAIWDKLDV